ncbi:MAG: BON domain-containing protein [Pseudomonadota bacterium]|nr:BON domain-containing protein [Pseudomonadota bacterium]
MIFLSARTISAAAACLFLVSGCVPVIAGGAAATAVTTSESRGFSGAVSDTQIQAELNDRWFKANVDMYDRLDMTIHKGRVLLTGAAKDEEQRARAVELAWQVNGVKEVYNEIFIDDGRTVLDSANDTWIRTQVSTRLTFDPEVKSQNYFVDTVGGVVYLLGEARDQAELDRALAQANSVSGVQRVVSYVNVAGTE